LKFLRQWKEEIQSKIDGEAASAAAETAVAPSPDSVDRSAELRAQIELAVSEERYEDAAMLRDELRRIEPQ
jgi:hypothetical protein